MESDNGSMEGISSSSGATETSTTETSAVNAGSVSGGEASSKVLGAEGAGDSGDHKTPPGAGASTPGEVPAWTPNYKFKVKDKELEFDDFIKPIVKTKDLEAKLRDMYEKAHGLDEVKTSRETFKQQAEEWKGKFSQVEQSLQTLGAHVKKGDYRTFFQLLNIPKDQIIKYAIEELKYQELPPEQRHALEQQRQQQTEFEMAQAQNQTLQQQMAQMVQQQAVFELDQELAKPEVNQAISSYDARLGKPGAFKSEVIRRGQYYEAVHKISPPARQLVEEILSLVGVQAQTQQGFQATSQGQSGQTVQNQQQKPVIAGFSGGSAMSPTRKVPSSIADLRKMREQLST